jgi:hypothetical protein
MSVFISIPESSCGIQGGACFDGKKFLKSHNEDSWWIDPPNFVKRSINDSMPVFGRSPPQIITQSLKDAYSSVTSSSIPWISALGKDRFLKVVSRAYKETEAWLESDDVKDYMRFHLLEREVLSLLQSTKVDTREFESRKSSPSVESFRPNSSGYAPTVLYSQATSTGRLKVVEGPKILTISRQDRKVISSRFSDGRILQVDFVSLEPRVALYSVGQNPGSDDVYEWIARSVGSNLSRSKVKVPTLSILYGQAARNDDPVSSSLREKIGAIFRVNDLRERVTSGRFTNGYGRPLEQVEDRLVISHFVQSTAVDVALLGFRKLLADLSSNVGNGIVPIFVLHDALILDVSPEFYGLLKKRVEEGVNVDPLGHFPLSLGPIWDE